MSDPIFPAPEELFTCPECGRSNFTRAGLLHHRCKPHHGDTETQSNQPPILPTAGAPTAGAPAVQYRPAQQLKVHPAVKAFHAWEDDDADFLSLVADVRRHGITQPVLITADGLILDGRHRVRAAKAAGVQVPCIVDADASPEHALDLALRTLKHRRQYTASQLACIAWPALEAQYRAAQDAALRGLKGSGIGPVVAVKTVQQLAADLGVHRTYLSDAARVHALWSEHQDTDFTWTDEVLSSVGLTLGERYTLRDVFERLIMRKEKPVGLGAAFAGMAARVAQAQAEARGKKHPGGKPAEPEKQLRLFTEVFDDLETRFEYWTAFDADDRSVALEKARTSIAAMPDDLLTNFDKIIRSEIKRRAQTAS